MKAVKFKIIRVTFLWTALVATYCGTDSKTEKRVEKTTDEKIRVALDTDDLDTAMVLLEEQIAAEPEQYERYVILSAVYAAKSGFDLIAAASATGVEAKSVMELIGEFIPDTIDEDNLTYVKKAVDQLLEIPAAKRALDAAETYSTSAALQLTLYQSAYSVMYLKQFIEVGSDGLPSLDKLRTMSDEDARIVLESLAEAARNAPDGQGKKVADKIDSTLEKIDGAEGDNDREKLISYMQTQKT